MQRIQVIDSHTAGEPTRVVIAGGPDLGSGPLAERRQILASRFDDFRSAVVNEPRGSDVLVGALLVPPVEPGCAAGVIFFNNVGTLGMCGHGAIGVVATLRHLGRWPGGASRLDTPVGAVAAQALEDGSVTIANVASRRHAHQVAVEVPGLGRVVGDVAWGGNWFFIAEFTALPLESQFIAALTSAAQAIRSALDAAGITGADGAPIDHIELCAPSPTPGFDARNFVLCPGGAYDRSPCGTGTSAKLACLAAEGLLAQGQPWVQESIIGTTFEGRYRRGEHGEVLPTIRGRAWITAESSLLFAPDDPFGAGIRGTAGHCLSPHEELQ